MTDIQLQKRYEKAKKALFRTYYNRLNDEQLRAVCTVNDPLLVLAGAGSGKTTVLVQRIAFIIRYGNAYFDNADRNEITEEYVSYLEAAASFSRDEIGAALSDFASSPAPAWSVLAITFTNKAANEMKERLARELGEEGGADEIWAGTFHSICMRILRRYGERVGYSSGFTIYDSDDSKRLALDCMHSLDIDEKMLPVKSVLSEIGRAKDKLISPDEYEKDAKDLKLRQIARIYREYQGRLRAANALDFDDIICQTVRCLRENPDVLEYYSKRFRYVCVDEYQDTNYAQFVLTSLLASYHKNIMVVGDDDQSIYKFRGATIENILGFDRVYPDATVIKLEQNYRSSGNILSAANAVIEHNAGRKGKKLWTAGDKGSKLTLYCAEDQNEEARYIVDTIMERVLKEGKRYSDFAVLYRVNAQANALESVFARSAVPYRVIGSMRFYDHKEIRDALAYLHVIDNPSDTLRLKRIINEPKRKIGDATVSALEEIASLEGRSVFEVMRDAANYPSVSRAADRLGQFVSMIDSLIEISKEKSVSELLTVMLDESGYRQMLIDGGEAEKGRLDNLEELLSGIIEYETNAPEPSLGGYLEDVALVADLDKYDESTDAAILMTVHNAKGLEFPTVFLPGLEDGIFPGMQSAVDPTELEEERRLAYVALTRAKQDLYLVYASKRMMYGRTTYNPVSRFVSEIPKDCIDDKRVKKAAHSVGYSGGASGYGSGYSRSGAGTFGDRQGSSRAGIYAEMNKTPAAMQKKPSAASFERFDAGVRVKHPAFGGGMVLSAKDMGGDVLYEIAFDSVGTKKLMGTYAKLKKE